jgi:hypothetical protein
MSKNEPQAMTPEQFHEKFPTVMEINKGCVKNYACPHCGSRGPFSIKVVAFVELADDVGFSLPYQLEETDAPALCLDCDSEDPCLIIDGLDEFLAKLAK